MDIKINPNVIQWISTHDWYPLSFSHLYPSKLSIKLITCCLIQWNISQNIDRDNVVDDHEYHYWMNKIAI